MSDPVRGMRVLHVDDNRDFAEMAATFLERADDRFDVEVATSADEGIDCLAAEAFDCVVSDHDMPGMTGIDFLRAVRDDDPDLPFVLFTGKGSEEVASEAISAGVTDYLQKEGGTDQYAILANRIANAVEHYRKRTDLRMYRLAVEGSTDLLAACDTEYTLLFANERYRAYHDLSADDVYRTTLPEILGDAWPVVKRHVDRTLAGDVVRYEMERPGPDGEDRTLDISYYPIRTDDGSVLGAVAAMRDLTEDDAVEPDRG